MVDLLEQAKILEQFVGTHHVSDLSVQNFVHDGIPVRGLRSGRDFAVGEPVLKVPRWMLPPSPEELGMNTPGTSDEVKLANYALWLAEQKSKIGAAPPRENHTSSPNDTATLLVSSLKDMRDGVWSAYVRSLPSLHEYRLAGLPLAATETDLTTLEQLPRVKNLAAWVRHTHLVLRDQLDLHNRQRTTSERLSWFDAVWALTSLYGRAFNHDNGEANYVPIGDLINHGGSHSNVDYKWVDSDSSIHYVANRHIKKGEEITDDYATNGSNDELPQDTALGMAMHYGLVDKDLPHEYWGDEDCASLKAANLQGSGLMETAKKLINHYCKAEVGNGVLASSTSVFPELSTSKVAEAKVDLLLLAFASCDAVEKVRPLRKKRFHNMAKAAPPRSIARAFL